MRHTVTYSGVLEESCFSSERGSLMATCAPTRLGLSAGEAYTQRQPAAHPPLDFGYVQ